MPLEGDTLNTALHDVETYIGMGWSEAQIIQYIQQSYPGISGVEAAGLIGLAEYALQAGAQFERGISDQPIDPATVPVLRSLPPGAYLIEGFIDFDRGGGSERRFFSLTFNYPPQYTDVNNAATAALQSQLAQSDPGAALKGGGPSITITRAYRGPGG